MIVDLRKLRWILPYLILVGVVTVVLSQSAWFWRLLYPIHHKEVMFHYAREYGVDPYLVAAVIRVESKYYPQALSPMGARGLMQVMPETGAWVAEQLGLEDFEPEQLFDPETNIRIGTWYLANLKQEFGDLTFALAAYNGGRGNVRRWLEMRQSRGETLEIEDFPFPETRVYVTKVLYNYRRYREIYQSNFNGKETKSRRTK